MIDDRDRSILAILQRDAETPLQEVAERVGLSASACSRRIARLEETGHIVGRVAVLDRKRMGLPTTVFVLVKTAQHSAEWVGEFNGAVGGIPEIVEVHRLTGNFDYILKIVLPDVEHYDVVYKRLVQRIELFDMSAYISMETVKLETGLPTRYA